ncbi:MAG: recombination-associated protein RdgC [Acidiferrobacterales bacterium]|nr:recombination-associated protein RdgC [Acidiferrobacterales bacterium]
MWFKNLIIFEFEDPADALKLITEPQLERGLASQAFKPCGPQEPESLGWTTPMGHLSDQLFHAGGGYFLLTARREERLLPASVVREAVNEKVLEIELAEERKVGRKQKLEIRDQLTFEMMPRAFTRSVRTQGLILPKENLIVVDAASRKTAEQWVSLLRISLGSLPVRPVESKQSLPALFTNWLSGKASLPNQISLGEECDLQSQEDQGAVVRFRRQMLEGDEITVHTKAGKIATRLAVDWNESLAFTLTDALEIKRLRFADTVVEQVEVEEIHDEAAEFDARFALMGLEFSRFLPALFDALGGLQK